MEAAIYQNKSVSLNDLSVECVSGEAMCNYCNVVIVNSKIAMCSKCSKPYHYHCAKLMNVKINILFINCKKCELSSTECSRPRI